MIIGDSPVLAIESSISKAYERLSFRALGYFVIYVGGLCYGRRSADSTLLACSFDEVGRRLAMRGRHTMPFAGDADARSIAGAFRDAVYGDEPLESHLGLPSPKFREMTYSNRVVWAPDGDEAFDDGSYVLQFESTILSVLSPLNPLGTADMIPQLSEMHAFPEVSSTTFYSGGMMPSRRSGLRFPRMKTHDRLLVFAKLRLDEQSTRVAAAGKRTSAARPRLCPLTVRRSLRVLTEPILEGIAVQNDALARVAQISLTPELVHIVRDDLARGSYILR